MPNPDSGAAPPPGHEQEAVQLALDLWRPALSPVAGSGRVTLRHSRSTAYGCSLPGLTGFTAPGRAGPDHRRCLPGAARPSTRPQASAQPGVSGVSGTGDPEPPTQHGPRQDSLRASSVRPGPSQGAETKGFEPLGPLQGHAISSRADSAALARLRRKSYRLGFGRPSPAPSCVSVQNPVLCEIRRTLGRGPRA